VNSTTIYKNLAEGATILEWLIIGYLFYKVDDQISIFLFGTFIIGIVSKLMLFREEEKLERQFIEKIKQKIEKENERIDSEFDL
jgi:c-di-AMP phosphodiesterase-like protein